jgi:hypothetical protein
MPELRLLDAALIDGVARPVRHRIEPSTTAPTADGGAAGCSYDVWIEAPLVNATYSYDPTLGLGLLVAADANSAKGDATSSDVLVLAVGVSVGAAVLLVVLAVSAATAVGWWRWHKRRPVHGSVQFVGSDAPNNGAPDFDEEGIL